MKKTATLVAGLLLVSGTIFGADWKLNHTLFESTYNFADSINGPLSTNEKMEWDETFRLKVEAETKLGNFGSLSTFADFSKGTDEREVSVQYKRTANDFEVGLGAEILAVNPTTKDMEFSIYPKYDKNTYFKWNVLGSKKIALTYYPWEAPMSWEDWDTMETFIHKDPGMVLDVKATDKTSVTFKVATLNEDDFTKENYLAINTSLKTSVVGVNLQAYGAFTTEDEDNKELGFGIMAEKNLTKKLNVKASFNSMKKGSDKDDNKVGAFGKVSYRLNDFNKYIPTAYAQALYKNEAAVGDTDTTGDGGNLNGWVSGKGNLTKLEAGLKMQQGNFTVTPKVIVETREKNAYVEYKGTQFDYTNESKAVTAKSFTTVGVTFSHEVWN